MKEKIEALQAIVNPLSKKFSILNRSLIQFNIQSKIQSNSLPDNSWMSQLVPPFDKNQLANPKREKVNTYFETTENITQGKGEINWI